MEQEFNGFSNYATWNCNLYFNNEVAYYNELEGFNTAQDLEAYVKERFNSNGGFGDLFTESQIEEINFVEVYEANQSK